MRALSWALEPSQGILGRARAVWAAEEDPMGSKGAVNQTARVAGPGGTVVIPLRLVKQEPEEVARLVRLATIVAEPSIGENR